MVRKAALVLGSIALSVILFLLHFFLSAEPWYGKMINVLSVILSLLAAIAAFIAYSEIKEANGVEARRFLFFFAGLAFWFLAESAWSFYELILNEIAPQLTLADLFWLLGYFPLAYSLFLGFRQIKFQSRAAILTLMSYVVIGGVVLFLLRDAIISSEASFEVNMINMGYVLGDISLLALSAPLLLGFAYLSRQISWFTLWLGLAFSSLGDIHYFFLSAQGLYDQYVVTYIFYLISYVWLGATSLVYLRERRKK